MIFDSGKLTRLLEERHAGHIRADQCKMGWSGTPIMDFWVMVPTWTRLHTIGYEIKVDRQDFLHDKKWRQYLPACSQFFFCAPRGLIKRDELPKEAGLIEPFENGSGLRISKQAPDSEAEQGAVLNVLRHILMWKGEETRLQRAERWVAEVRLCKTSGVLTSEAISKAVTARVGEIEKENERLEIENGSLESVKKWAAENKVDISKMWWTVESELEQKFKPRQKKALEQAREAIDQLLCNGTGKQPNGKVDK
jgi:hypothetical protein